MKKVYRAPLAVIVFGLLLVIYIVKANVELAENQLKSNQQQLMSSVLERLNQGVREADYWLHGVAGFYQASQYVDFDEYITFNSNVTSGDLLIASSAWVPLVPKSEAPEFERKFNELGINKAQFNLAENSLSQDIQFPFYYFYPEALGREFMGTSACVSEAICSAFFQNYRSPKDYFILPPKSWQHQVISSISIWKPVIKKGRFMGFLGVFLDFGKTTYFKSSLSVLKKQKMGIKLSLIEKDQLIPLLDINPSDMKEDYVVRNQLQGRAGDDESFFEVQLIGPKNINVITAQLFVLPFGLLIFVILIALLVYVTNKQQEYVEEQVRQRTEELRVEKQKATDANQAKSSFLATISHELRTPLNGLSGMFQALRNTPLNEKQQHYLVTAQESTRRLEGMITNVLMATELDSGVAKIRPEMIAIGDRLEPVLLVWQKTAAEKGLGFVYRFTEKNQIASVDVSRLIQLINNIISNAIKYTNKGKVTVLVDIELKEDKKGNLVVDVDDTGQGINADQLPYMYEFFNQVERLGSRQYGGAGLGLAISKKIVDLMGGTISINSMPNMGTSVRIIIPTNVA